MRIGTQSRVRRFGWLGAAALAAAGCRPGELPRSSPAAAPPARVAPTPTGAAPTVRVGVAVDSAALAVGGTGAYTLSGPDNDVLAASPASETWTVSADGADGLRLASGSRSVVSRTPVRVRSAAGGTLSVGGLQYRGDVLLRRGGAGVTAVNVLDLETYLLGVVAREIGRRPLEELEAVKAQAVAARTYAVGNMGGREPLGFDFHASDRDQVYGGVAAEDVVASRAVAETRGEIVTWEGAPILAYYSSTCGGHTAAIEESWPWRAPLPYLRPVSDEIPGTGTYYCSTSNRFHWTAKWTRDELRTTLGQSLRAHTGGRITALRAVNDVRITRSGPSGRKTLTLVADGTEYELRADSLRWVLRTPTGAGLNSSRIDDLDAQRDGAGVVSLNVRGGGWGHGVGMCQVGAMGRARAGQTYREILAAYYTDTGIRRLY